MNENNTGIVTFELDVMTPTPLTDAEKSQLDHLRGIDDDAIDFGVVPHQESTKKWTRPSTRRSASAIPLDDDVLEFFKTDGMPDPARVNAALREYMQTHTK